MSASERKTIDHSCQRGVRQRRSCGVHSSGEKRQLEENDAKENMPHVRRVAEGTRVRHTVVEFGAEGGIISEGVAQVVEDMGNPRPHRG